MKCHCPVVSVQAGRKKDRGAGWGGSQEVVEAADEA